jgi:plasmid stability protein
MPDILVRNVKPETAEYLRCRAEGHGRSLQAEIIALLDDEAAREKRREEFWLRADAFRASLSGREHSDSAELRHIGRPQE